LEDDRCLTALGTTIMADDNLIGRIPTNQIRQEPGAHELASSPDMKPYLEFIKAVIQDHDPSPELEAIPQLPLEKRYIWTGGLGSEVGPCRLRKHERRGRQANIDARGVRQGNGPVEIAPDSVLHFAEDAGRNRGDGEDDGPGDQGCETGAVIAESTKPQRETGPKQLWACLS
jgi:hypothetical protein